MVAGCERKERQEVSAAGLGCSLTSFQVKLLLH